ncbi:tumor necrosis factor receptor superfamily member 18 isoform X2 [Thalassophryne amazonica]|nr:tumor necrosis factor receptor superfamily member 18 isoform X2 [Thalassophryne amazonica]
MEVNGRCCDLCPPGEYLETLCSEDHQTVCRICENGTFLNYSSIFDRCEKCHTCQHEYKEKCTSTTNAKCLCHPGFRCSDHICSECEEEIKCEVWEKLKSTVSSSGGMMCEPACPENAYFDIKENICKPLTQCSAKGLTVLIPGNKTHNSVCDIPGTHNGDNANQMLLGAGFFLLSLVGMFLFYSCAKSLHNIKANMSRSDETAAVAVSASDFQLSKEESGLQLINKDETKDTNSTAQLHLDKAMIF